MAPGHEVIQPLPTVGTSWPRKMMDVRDVHERKALIPIDITPLGMVIDVREVHK
jgi:hypothetical protein